MGLYLLVIFDQRQDVLMPQSERATYTVEEAAALLGLSRNLTYEAIAAGKLPALRIGRRLLVPRMALTRMLEMVSSKAA